MKGSSRARTEAGLREVEGNFQRKMNQADLPEQERRLLAELKELCRLNNFIYIDNTNILATEHLYDQVSCRQLSVSFKEVISGYMGLT